MGIDDSSKSKAFKIVLIVSIVLVVVGAILLSTDALNEDKINKANSVVKQIVCTESGKCTDYLESERIPKDYSVSLGTYTCENLFDCQIEKIYYELKSLIVKDNNTFYVYNLDTKEKDLLSAGTLEPLGFKELNIDESHKSEDFSELDTFNYYFTLDNNYNYKAETDSGKQLRITIESGKLYFVSEENKAEISINDFKTVYINSEECIGVKNIYVLTNGGTVHQFDYHVNSTDTLNKLAKSFKIIKSDYKYASLNKWTLATSTCGSYFGIIGTTAEGAKILMNKNMPFDNIKANYANHLLTTDNELYIIDEDAFKVNSKVVNIYMHEGILNEYLVLFENRYLYSYEIAQ